MSHNTTISARALLLTAFLVAFAICYLYAHSVTLVYGVLELLIAVVCYAGCLKQYRTIDGNSLVLGCSAVVLTWCTGLFHGDLKSTLLITVPLLMPLYISSLKITYKDWTDFVPTTIIAVVITYLAIEKRAFGQINSNTIGFMGFMGVSIGVLWIKNAKKRIFPTALVLFGFYCAIRSGSRNVAVVGLLCLVLIFLPKAILKKPLVYVSICLAVMLYSIFTAEILDWIFSEPKLNDLLVEYTDQYSEKTWEMAGRVEFLEMLQSRIAKRDILEQLFGTGNYTIHGHNMFLQCVANFGYIGMVLVYGMFYRVFKLAYLLIVKKQDDVALGCVIVLWGIFLLQGADVFVVGHETYPVIPQVIMGIILNRYSIFENDDVETSRVGVCGKILRYVKA